MLALIKRSLVFSFFLHYIIINSDLWDYWYSTWNAVRLPRDFWNSNWVCDSLKKGKDNSLYWVYYNTSAHTSKSTYSIRNTSL